MNVIRCSMLRGYNIIYGRLKLPQTPVPVGIYNLVLGPVVETAVSLDGTITYPYPTPGPEDKGPSRSRASRRT